MSESRRDTLITAATVIAILAVWYLGAALVQAGDDPLAEAKLPFPHQVIDVIFSNTGELGEASWISLRQALIGFVIGSLVGIVFSLVMAQGEWVESAIVPFLLAGQMVPMIALVPIVQNIFQNDDVTRVFISAFITFFSVTVAVVRGLKSAPPSAYELMSSYNTGRLQRLRYLEIPAAVPMLFTGLRIAAPLSLVGSVLVDLAGAQSGLGYIMLAALTAGGPTGSMLIWGAMVILIVLGFLLAQAVVLSERIVAPWQVQMRAKGA